MRKQLTFFPDRVDNCKPCSNGGSRFRNGFLFSKDSGGAENYQIYYYDFQTGKYQMVTDGKSRNGTYCWSNAGDRFAHFSTKRNGTDNDIYVSTLPENGSAAQSECVYEAKGSFFVVDWSPDDRFLLLQHYISTLEQKLYILELATKKVTQIGHLNGDGTDTGMKVSYSSARFSKTGRGVFFTCDYKSEFLQLRYYDLDKKQVTQDLTSDIEWDVDKFDLSHSGKEIAAVV